MAVMRATAASASVYAWRPLTPAARNGSNSEVCSEAVAMPQHSMPQGTRPRPRVPLAVAGLRLPGGLPMPGAGPRGKDQAAWARIFTASDRPTRSLEQVVVVVIIVIVIVVAVPDGIAEIEVVFVGQPPDRRP